MKIELRAQDLTGQTHHCELLIDDSIQTPCDKIARLLNTSRHRLRFIFNEKYLNVNSHQTLEDCGMRDQCLLSIKVRV